MKNILIATALIATILLPVSTATTRAATATNNTSAKGLPAGHPAMTEPTLHVGDTAPALLISKWIKGAPVTEFTKGKTYVVEFWATWCGPCRMTIPHLTALQAKYKDVTVIGVNVWERDLALVEPFVKEMGTNMNYTVAMEQKDGNKGQMGETWMEAAGAHGIPHCFVVDGNGKIAWMGHPGQLDRILPAILNGTFDSKKEAEFQAKMKEVQTELARAMRSQDAAKALVAVDELKKLDPSTASQYDLTRLMVLYNIKKDYAAGNALAKQLAETEFKTKPQMMGYVAMLMLNGAPTDKRDMLLALEILQSAYAQTGDKDLGIVNGLAKTYAEMKQFDKAVEFQTKLVAALKGRTQEREQTILDEYKAKLTPTKPQS